MTQIERGLLHWLVDYELRSSHRYRRFLAVVSVACDHGRVGFKDIVSDVLRDSDEVVEKDLGAAILMGETDGAGALTAISRYKARCEGAMDMRFGVATYPRDGCDATTLLEVAGGRLEEARMGAFGAVVWQEGLDVRGSAHAAVAGAGETAAEMRE